jgi:hypothetical protein
VDFMQRAGHVPPVVVARYGEALMPLDGAYRIAAHAELGRKVDAWLISGTSYDKLCDLTNRPEDYVICGTVPAMEVAVGSGRPDSKSTRGPPGETPPDRRQGPSMIPRWRPTSSAPSLGPPRGTSERESQTSRRRH